MIYLMSNLISPVYFHDDHWSEDRLTCFVLTPINNYTTIYFEQFSCHVDFYTTHVTLKLDVHSINICTEYLSYVFIFYILIHLVSHIKLFSHFSTIVEQDFIHTVQISPNGPLSDTETHFVLTCVFYVNKIWFKLICLLYDF